MRHGWYPTLLTSTTMEQHVELLDIQVTPRITTERGNCSEDTNIKDYLGLMGLVRQHFHNSTLRVWVSCRVLKK